MRRPDVLRCVKGRSNAHMRRIRAVIRPVADVNVWRRAVRDVVTRKFVRYVRIAAAKSVSENSGKSDVEADQADVAVGKRLQLLRIRIGEPFKVPRFFFM